MDAITSKLSVVDEGTQKAATLMALTDDVDNQMTSIASHQQLVEKMDTRLNSLNALSISVDKRFEELITRRNDVESLKNVCDGLGLQVTTVHQKLDAVSALQHKLLPLTTQVAILKTQIDKVQTVLKKARRDNAELASQEKRLSELVDGSRSVATSVEERLKQVQGLTEELSRGTGVKDELVQELGRIHGRQRDVAAHVQASEEQLKRVDAQLKQLGQRHSKLAFAEKKLATFEGRLGDLKSLSDDVDRKDPGHRGARGVRRFGEERGRRGALSSCSKKGIVLPDRADREPQSAGTRHHFPFDERPGPQ